MASASLAAMSGCSGELGSLVVRRAAEPMAAVAGGLPVAEQGSLSMNEDVTEPREVRLGWKEERFLADAEMTMQVRQSACFLASALHLERPRAA